MGSDHLGPVSIDKLAVSKYFNELYRLQDEAKESIQSGQFAVWLDEETERFGPDNYVAITSARTDEERRALDTFVAITERYASDNYITKVSSQRSFPTSSYPVSIDDKIYEVEIVSGQGTVYAIRRVEDLAEGTEVVPLQDALDGIKTPRAEAIDAKLHSFGAMATEFALDADIPTWALLSKLGKVAQDIKTLEQ